MKHRGLLLIVAVGALVSAPLVTEAGGQHGGGGRGGVFVKGPVGGKVVVQPQVRFAPVVPRVVVATPSVFPKPIDPWRFWGVQHRPFGHHGFGHKSFGHGFVGSSVIPFGVAAPSYYYATAPDVVYAAPAPIVAAPAPSSSMPTLVEYENGFYELRGDGITVAYRWVWIPKVPAPPDPPPAVVPPAAPAQAPSSPPARASEERPRKPTPVYRWTDEQGVTTYTDRLERVPERYRNQAKANVLQ